MEQTDHKKIKLKNPTPSIFRDELQSNAASHDQWKRAKSTTNSKIKTRELYFPYIKFMFSWSYGNLDDGALFLLRV
jgi:hypothetical protein